MALSNFFTIAEKPIDTDTDPNLPIVKPAISNRSAFGGSAIHHLILPNGVGGTSSVGLTVGANDSRVYPAKTDVVARMALLYNAHGGYVSPNFDQVITDIDQPFNFAGIALSSAETTQANWFRPDVKTSPFARSQFDMVYDSEHKYTLLFGGANGNIATPDTWTWNGVQWSAFFTFNSPTDIINFAMAFDSGDGYTLLFGGHSVSANTDSSSTFIFDGVDWLVQSPAGHPSARWGHAMVYDSHRNKTVLFGGTTSNGITFSNETWEYDGTNWTHVTPSTSPAGRYWHAMTFDSSRNKVVLMGGYGKALTSALSGSINSSVTSITLTSTTNFPTTGVILVDSEQISYDGLSGATLINCVRGFNNTTPATHSGSTTVFELDALNDTWEYDGVNWTSVFASNSLSTPRFAHKMVFNAVQKTTLLFGGRSTLLVQGGDLNDTWQYDGLSWVQLNTSAPSQRENFGMAYDTDRDVVVLFGGQNSQLTDASADTWEFNSPVKFRPVVVQTSGDGYVYWDASSGRPTPSINDFLGPSAVSGTVTPISDGYSPVFGIATEGPVIDPNNAPNPLLITVNGSQVGLIKMSIRPFYGFIPPAPPSITSISPSAAHVGDLVTLTGDVFIGTTQVTMNNDVSSDAYANASFSVVSNNQITLTVPAGSEKGTITVTNVQGDSTSLTDFSTLPVITSVVASGQSVGSTITIHGHTFTHTTSITFNGTNQPVFTVNSDIQITTTIPSGATTGSIVVTITYPAAETHTASFPNFGVVAPPVISSVAPLAGPIGPLSFTTLNGAIDGYVTTIPVVSTTGFPSIGTILIDSEQITYDSIDPTNFFDGIRGSNGTTATGHLDAAGVTSTQVNPDGFVSITGSGFFVTGAGGDGYGVVEFVGPQTLQAQRTIFNDTVMSVIVPAPGVPQPPTDYNIRITTDGGVDTFSSPFTIISAPEFLSPGSTTLSGALSSPSITSISVGSTSSFTSDGYLFIDQEQMAYSVSGPSTFNVVRGANGTVATTHLNSAVVKVFTAASPSTTSSVSTVSGKSGDLVRVFGKYGFTGASTVDFTGFASPLVHVINDEFLTAVVPIITSDTDVTGPISVRSIGGTKSTADAPTTFPINFTILVAPEINSISPTSGKANDTVSIFGVNLLSVASVTFTGNFVTALNGGIDDGYTTIAVTSTTGFPTTGLLLIDSEQLSYSGTNTTHFTGCIRGVNSTVAASHNTATPVQFIVASTFSTVSARQLNAIVPDVSTGILLAPSAAPITVTKGSFAVSSSQSFTFYPPPSISSVDPAADSNGNNGGYGTPVTIHGSNLDQGGIISLTFGGVSAAILSHNGSTITTIVPNGAGSGITLTTHGGTVTHAFVVAQPVAIASFCVPTSSSVRCGQPGCNSQHTTSINFYNTVDVCGANFTANMTANVIDPNPSKGSLPVVATFYSATSISFSSSGLAAFIGDTCSIQLITTYPGGSYSTSVYGLQVTYLVG